MLTQRLFLDLVMLKGLCWKGYAERVAIRKAKRKLGGGAERTVNRRKGRREEDLLSAGGVGRRGEQAGRETGRGDASSC
jgi:hypothetical protein